jgi:hypothetical protein
VQVNVREDQLADLVLHMSSSPAVRSKVVVAQLSDDVQEGGSNWEDQLRNGTHP